MAKKAEIIITDHAANCSDGYFVRYKPAASMDWTSMNGLQQVVPVVTPSPYSVAYHIEINGLANSTVYDFGITRQCCDGTLAGETLFSDTTPA